MGYDLSKSDVIPVEHLDDPIEISHEEYEELQRKHGEDGENGVLEISEDEYNELKARHKEKHEKVTDETGDTSEHNEQSVKHGQHHSEDKHGLYDTYDKQRLHKGSLSGEKQDSRQKLDKYAMKKCHTTRDTFIFKDKILYKESACWVLKEYTKTSFPYVRCSEAICLKSAKRKKCLPNFKEHEIWLYCNRLRPKLQMYYLRVPQDCNCQLSKCYAN